jgi:hypothetical protein
MKTTYTTLILMLLAAGYTQAQTAADILRLGTQNTYTTARVASMGGAFAALGGDLGATNDNVAGTGVFTKQHFVMAMGIQSNKNNTAYANKDQPDGTSKVYLGSFGYNLPLWNRETAKSPEKGLQNINLSVAYSRTHDFTNQTTLSGTNDKSSIAQRFAQDANGTPEAQLTNAKPYTAALAYNALLINPILGSNNQYYTPIAGAVEQLQTRTESGAGKDLSINLASNYNNKLYLGAGVGFVSSDYDNVKNFTEKDILDTMRYDFKSLSFSENINTAAQGGINAKLGFILVPFEFLRLGVGIQTATKLKVTDTYNTNLTVDFDNGDNYNYKPATTNSFNFVCYTPMRVNLGAALVIKQKAIISVDYVQSNYRQMRVSSENEPFWAADLNQKIKDTYSNAGTLRIGGEYRYTPAISLRAGYAAAASPFASYDYLRRQNISAGIGFRGIEGMYFDIAGVSSRYQSYYEPYTLTNAALYYGSITRHHNIDVLFTLGARF